MTGSPPGAAPAPQPIEGKARRLHFTTWHAVIGGGVLVLIFAAALAIRYYNGRDQRRYEALLKTSLDRIVTAQEGYYYDSTRYVGTLRALPTIQLPPGVHVQLFNPDRRSWWGIATHDGLPAHHCVVWVGTAPTTLPLEARAPENETKPVCFDDARPPGRQTRQS